MKIKEKTILEIEVMNLRQILDEIQRIKHIQECVNRYKNKLWYYYYIKQNER